MELIKHFENSFNTKCVFTSHAWQRLNERFLLSELKMLKFLVQASVKYMPLSKWEDNAQMVLIDPRFNISIIAKFSQQSKAVTLITCIRGKSSESYKDCKKIIVSILKEKAEQEVQELNSFKKSVKRNTFNV